eukprot:1403074-Amphidinium_carterae.3
MATDTSPEIEVESGEAGRNAFLSSLSSSKAVNLLGTKVSSSDSSRWFSWWVRFKEVHQAHHARLLIILRMAMERGLIRHVDDLLRGHGSSDEAVVSGTGDAEASGVKRSAPEAGGATSSTEGVTE